MAPTAQRPSADTFRVDCLVHMHPWLMTTVSTTAKM